APLRQGKRRPAPENAAVVGREHAGDRFHERGLACAVGSDQAEHLARVHRKGNVGKRALFAIALAETGNLHQRGGVAGGAVKEGGARHRHACTWFLRTKTMSRTTYFLASV